MKNKILFNDGKFLRDEQGHLKCLRCGSVHNIITTLVRGTRICLKCNNQSTEIDYRYYRKLEEESDKPNIYNTKTSS